MVRFLGFAAAALLATVALAQEKDKEKKQEDPAPVPGWTPDLADGFAEAKKSGKPLMIVFR